MQGKNEAVYLVDDKAYLHLKEAVTKEGFGYAAFDKATGDLMKTGLIMYWDMEDSSINNAMERARELAVEEVGLKGDYVAEVAVSTLEQVKDARLAFYRPKYDAPQEHSIRFITSKYDTLFRIPDGGVVEVRFPDRAFTAKCEYLDDYHTKVGNSIFHICEFAEFIEGQGGMVRPEAEITADQAAWQLGHREYLTLQKTDGGFDYTIYTREYELKDGGRLEAPDLSMREAREEILKMHGMAGRNRFAVSFEDVLDKAEAEDRSVLQELTQLKEQPSRKIRAKKEKTHGGKDSR